MKRLVVPVAVALALAAGCGAPDDEDHTDAYKYRLPDLSAHPSAVPATTCPPAGVLLRAGGTDGAAGLRALGISLLNCGHQTYRVDGYPVVEALDKDHHRMTVKVLHGTTEITGSIPDWNGPAQPITLRPGQQAECVVVWRNTYDDIRHPPVNAPYLEMAPAAGRPSQTLTPDGPVDLGSTGRLGVSPWRLAKPTTRTTPAAPPPSTQPSPVPSSIL